MLWFKKLLLKIGFLRKGDRFDNDLSEEMRLHLELMVEENIQAGMTKAKAHKAAIKKFGNMESIREECHQSWGTQLITGMAKEFRLGLRLLWKSKSFSVAVVLILAICVAGNTVIYSILNAVLSQPPYPDPERVVSVWISRPSGSESSNKLGGIANAACYNDFSKNIDAFESLALYSPRDANITVGDSPARAYGIWASKKFFDVFGLHPILGRYFEDEDFGKAPATEGVIPIVLTESFWRNELGGDRDILGKIVYVNSQPNTVIGVAPHDVGGRLYSPHFYRPWNHPYILNADQMKRMRYSTYADLVGRLKEGVSIENAQVQITTLDQQFYDQAAPSLQQMMDRTQIETRIASLQEIALANEGNSLFLLQGSALAVLLIGCINVANLLIGRGVARRSEFAMRVALGASRIVLLRQVFLECLALAFIGCLLGVCLVLPLTVFFNQFLLNDFITFSWIDPLSPTISSAFFLIGLSIGIGLLLGLFSSASLVFSKTSLLTPINVQSSQSTPAKSILFVKSTLVSLQVASAFVLLVIAGLLMESFRNAINTDSGFETKGVYVSKLGLTVKNWSGPERKTEFRNRLKASLLETPGIESVSFASRIPIVDGLTYTGGLSLPGTHQQLDERTEMVRYITVSPEYFESAGIKLLRGRYFNLGDSNKKVSGIIIDRSFAERYYDGVDPIGKHIGFGSSFNKSNFDPNNTPAIVGVVENVKHRGLDNSQLDWGPLEQPLFYRVYNNNSRDLDYNILIKSNRPAEEVFELAQEEVSRIDPQLPLFLNQSLDALFRGTLNHRRAYMLLVSLISSMALILSAIGIYGVLAYDVAQRTREFGIRMALGASKKRILKIVLHQGAAKVSTGLALGIIGVYLVSDLISGLLFQVEPTEPVTYSLVAGFVLIISLLASFVPAKKALLIHPMEAIRIE